MDLEAVCLTAVHEGMDCLVLGATGELKKKCELTFGEKVVGHSNTIQRLKRNYGIKFYACMEDFSKK